MERGGRLERALFVAAGCVLLGLGAVATVVPMVPTTPFVLLAAACFARGSRRLHSWLLAHATFGPIIHHYRRDGSMPRWAKRRALMAIAVSFAVSVAVVPVLAVKPLLVCIGLGVALYVSRLPVPQLNGDLR